MTHPEPDPAQVEDWSRRHELMIAQLGQAACNLAWQKEAAEYEAATGRNPVTGGPADGQDF